MGSLAFEEALLRPRRPEARRLLRTHRSRAAEIEEESHQQRILILPTDAAVHGRELSRRREHSLQQ